ncbi:uncharacterized protein [Blastocystis hominis]|uniref:Uncharacterized protein n=1 Tax=Blastocystis hominis TaxID=12968 RepID=D8M025_BLAHO|nr:uncharacterized protein [Blastocystis hominis]CBK21414.2 unnamed protein product [Blastocystis hominis]|eukprot:XP_012895462.1 uncharacterized protein [Blastocystis hominis]
MRSKNKYIVNTNVDLPKLTSLINSDGYCFFYPRSVTLENIANLTNLNLTNSFDRVQSKVITNVSAEFVNLVTNNQVIPIFDIELLFQFTFLFHIQQIYSVPFFGV